MQRACQAAIDIAMYIVSVKNLGVPQSKKGVFTILEENNIIDSNMAKNMKGMLGFRNIAVYEYQELDLDIIKSIIENNLQDIIEFAREMLNKNDIK